jgi:P27 family predicted phage terminase small subunit
MARPRMSDAHHELLGSKYRNRAKTESTMAADQPKMPSHLSPEARREWRRVLPMLLERRSLTEGDATALGLYVEIFARWVLAKRELLDSGITIQTTVLDKRGSAVQTRKANPALRVVENCERSLRASLRELGLTPSTRERVLPAKPKEDESEETLLDLMKRENGE